MKIKYNAPTTLTYTFFCVLVVLADHFLFHGLTRAFFTVPNAASFNLLRPVNYLRLFTHIAGHADWNHLMGNMAYVLLLGPMLEEAYGSLTMFLMIVVTGFVTGVLNACFFPQPLLGASGVVFMMILLASFTNHGDDDIPLTFILIVILYLGREILNAFNGDDISQFAHLAGGLCGSLFGFFKPARSGQSLSEGRTTHAQLRSGREFSSPQPKKGTSVRIHLEPARQELPARKPSATKQAPSRQPQPKGSTTERTPPRRTPDGKR